MISQTFRPRQKRYGKNQLLPNQSLLKEDKATRRMEGLQEALKLLEIYTALQNYPKEHKLEKRQFFSTILLSDSYGRVCFFCDCH